MLGSSGVASRTYGRTLGARDPFFPGACAHAQDQEPTFEKESRAFQLSEGTPAWDVGFAGTQADGVDPS